LIKNNESPSDWGIVLIIPTGRGKMSNTFVFKGLKTLLCATAFITSFQACADIVISGTRIIYPQSSKDVVVGLENRGNKPLLVQTWLDDGRDDVNPQELKLPFVITPPVSRIDPKKGNRFVLPTWVNLCHRIVKRCIGLTYWKSRQNQKQPMLKI
jgi:hypothetical protein